MLPQYRSLLRKWIPKTFLDIRSGYISKSMGEQQKLELILHSQIGGQVLGGPFKGLKYSAEACGSMLGPKLLGTYERELLPVLEEIISTRYEQIIDIGAAEGYYAVGLLKTCPQTTVTAFETSAGGRDAMNRMAQDNGVDERLTILGFCDTQGLSDIMEKAGTKLLICDIEGGEKHLLDPTVIDGLTKIDILVEIHDFVDLAISSTIYPGSLVHIRSREFRRRIEKRVNFRRLVILVQKICCCSLRNVVHAKWNGFGCNIGKMIRLRSTE